MIDGPDKKGNPTTTIQSGALMFFCLEGNKTMWPGLRPHSSLEMTLRKQLEICHFVTSCLDSTDLTETEIFREFRPVDSSTSI